MEDNQENKVYCLVYGFQEGGLLGNQKTKDDMTKITIEKLKEYGIQAVEADPAQQGDVGMFFGLKDEINSLVGSGKYLVAIFRAVTAARWFAKSKINQMLSSSRQTLTLSLSVKKSSHDENDQYIPVGLKLWELNLLAKEITRLLASRYPFYVLDRDVDIAIEGQQFAASVHLDHRNNGAFSQWRLHRLLRGLDVRYSQQIQIGFPSVFIRQTVSDIPGSTKVYYSLFSKKIFEYYTKQRNES